jgi:predicted small metal-binding protein
MRADATARVIAQIIVHCKTDHGLTDEKIDPAMVSLWTARIRDAADGS